MFDAQNNSQPFEGAASDFQADDSLDETLDEQLRLQIAARFQTIHAYRVDNQESLSPLMIAMRGMNCDLMEIEATTAETFRVTMLATRLAPETIRQHATEIDWISRLAKHITQLAQLEIRVSNKPASDD